MTGTDQLRLTCLDRAWPNSSNLRSGLKELQTELAEYINQTQRHEMAGHEWIVEAIQWVGFVGPCG